MTTEIFNVTVNSIINSVYNDEESTRIIPRPVFAGYPNYFQEASWFINYLNEVHYGVYIWIDLDGFQGLISKSFAAKKKMAEDLGMGPDYRRTITYDDPETIKDLKSYWDIKTLAEKSGITIDHKIVYSGQIEDEHGRKQKLSRYLTKKLPKEFRACACSMFGSEYCHHETLNLSKTLSKLMEEVGKLKKKIIISCNPMDILYSSEHAGFSSCHSLSTETSENPCHRGGNISYMLDDHTFVCMTVSEGDKGPIPFKTGRMLGYLSSNRLHVLAMRCYGDFPEYGAKEVTQALTNTISKTLGIEYDWGAENKPSFEGRIKCNGYAGYIDRTYVSRYSHYQSESKWDFTLNLQRHICLSCGNKATEDDELFCADCHYPYECAGCDNLCRIDSTRGNDNTHYCPYCVSTMGICVNCNLVGDKDNFMMLSNISMCSHCYSAMQKRCEKCGESCHRREIKYNRLVHRFVCVACDELIAQEIQEEEVRRHQETNEAHRAMPAAQEYCLINLFSSELMEPSGSSRIYSETVTAYRQG